MCQGGSIGGETRMGTRRHGDSPPVSSQHSAAVTSTPPHTVTMDTQILGILDYPGSWLDGHGRTLMQYGATEFLRPLPSGQRCWGLNKARLGSSRLDVPIWSPGYQHCWQLCVDRFPPSFSFSMFRMKIRSRLWVK